MSNKVSTVVIENDIRLIDLIIEAINRTDYLIYKGYAFDVESVEEMCSEINAKLILLNINIGQPGFKEFSKKIKTITPDSFIVLMNLDEKKFANYYPEEKDVDGYLDLNDLFNEMTKISKYFEKS